MLGTILTFLIAYMFGVGLYTIIVRNDAMHKYAPDVSLKLIVKEGVKCTNIAFGIIMALYCIIYVIRYIFG